MKTAQQVNPGRLLVGLLLLVVGALLLFERAGWGDVGTLIGHWWPLIFVAAGLIQLGVSERLSAGPLIVAAFGLVLLLFTNNVISASFWSVFWPAILILVGLSFIFRRGFGTRAETSSADDVSALAIFGPNHVVSQSTAFHGGSATAIFGGVTLDLRQAQLAPGAAIDATVLFGGLDILVPKGWRVDLRGLPIFGGFDNKTTADGPLPEDAPCLNVSGMAAFGGIGIKHEK